MPKCFTCHCREVRWSRRRWPHEWFLKRMFPLGRREVHRNRGYRSKQSRVLLCGSPFRSFYDHSTERFQVMYRLGHEVIKTGFESTLPIILPCMSSEGDGRYCGID